MTNRDIEIVRSTGEKPEILPPLIKDMIEKINESWARVPEIQRLCRLPIRRYRRCLCLGRTTMGSQF
jgi:hypothetical protein